jgi:hypothetical protein
MPEQNAVNPAVLQGLYEHYLSQSIRLTEENVQLRVRIAELEQAGDESADE